jgi:hypothetical protein
MELSHARGTILRGAAALGGLLLLLVIVIAAAPVAVTAQTPTDGAPTPTPIPEQTICQTAPDTEALLVLGPLDEPAPLDASQGVSAAALQTQQIE